MAVTSGFFNSISGDRKYDAIQMSSIFDGIINDGIYQSYGDAFRVTPSSGTTVSVGVGRAWFNHTWTLNDSVLTLDCGVSEVLLNRVDCVCIEVDTSDAVRKNSIKVIQGTPSSNAGRPALANTATLHQYPLAFIRRGAGSTSIAAGDIVNMIGTSSTPFVTGPLKVLTTDMFTAAWTDQWNQWFNNMTTKSNTDFNNWFATEKSSFDTWFKGIQSTLSNDAAGNLAAQIAAIQAQIEELAQYRILEDTILDSSGAAITDSSGNNLGGEIVFAVRGDALADESTAIVPDAANAGMYIIY